MNADQLAQLLGAVALAAAPRDGGGGPRLPAFTSGVRTDWLSHRATFANVAEAREWTDLQKRRNLASSLQGEAAQMVQHITDQGFNPLTGLPYTFEELLAAYDAVFTPAAGGRASISEFYNCRQQPRESVLQYHTRLRQVFIRSFPGQPPETSHLIIHRFQCGLYNMYVKERCVDDNPVTYTAALNSAVSKEASLVMFREAGGNHRGGIHSIDQAGLDDPFKAIDGVKGRPAGAPGVRCFNCDKTGHFARDCDKPAKKGGRKKQRGQKGGGKGPSSSGKGKGGGRKAIRSLDQEDDVPATGEAEPHQGN